MPTILETDRLILRTWCRSDLEPFTRMSQDSKVMNYFKKTLSDDEAISFYKRMRQQYQDRGYTLYAVEEKQSGAFIGFVGFNYTEFPAHFTPAIEIGWRLDARYWGRGYATEAAKAALKHGFEELQILEVVSFTTPRNKASVRIMEKIGLRRNPSDDFLNPRRNEGDPEKLQVLYRLSRFDWQLQQTPVGLDAS